jgi:hypothetical protein
MKRGDEEECKARFDAFLSQYFVRSEITWEEVAQKDEPPDYYLLLDGTRFAVEVTQIVERHQVGGKRPLPHYAIVDELQRWVKDVEDAAKADGSLCGSYLVSFSTPIDNLGAVKDEIQEHLLDYIRNTANDERVPQQIAFDRRIPQQRPQQCGIEKEGSEPDGV